MQQVLQNLGNGQTVIEQIPVPLVRDGHLLIRSRATLISAGTERMLLEFGQASLLDKARQQPDKVRMVLDKVKTDGLRPTLSAVRDRLDQNIAMGYSNAGIVAAIGNGVQGYKVGDRVACNGHHAEFVCVPANLCAAIPAGVDDESASFTVLGAIAMQGVRLLEPTIGENVVVIGLGLVGLLTVQILRANGCTVLGIDPDAGRCRLAGSFGASVCNPDAGESPSRAAASLSGGRGVDAVIIAAATTSNDPVATAAAMCRQRGRIVLVGVAGLNLKRSDFYAKELSFQVSCSYGPGRYDINYEDKGIDYPVGFVRWSAQRNFEAILTLLASDAIDIRELISHRYPIDRALDAYQTLAGDNSLGIVLHYPDSPDQVAPHTQLLRPKTHNASPTAPVVAVIGAGNYASRVLIPALAKSSATLDTLVSANGVSGVVTGKKAGFAQTSTDAIAAIRSDSINTVIIASRHDSHAQLLCEALAQGKSVYVEKPLCLDTAELTAVNDACASASQTNTPLVMVGFNRRFAPQIIKLKSLLDATSAPKLFVMTVNAGQTPPDHWINDPELGGGRLIGEACHFVDLLRHLASSPISAIQASALSSGHGQNNSQDNSKDNVTITLSFEDGSTGTIHYLVCGHRSYPKERLEVYCDGAVIELLNFRTMTGYGWPGFGRQTLRRQDKGNSACVTAFIDAVEKGLPAPVPFEESVEATRALFAVVAQLRDRG